jgi:uncharacterized membrane protein YhaH (DUF805 family)
MWHYEKDGQPAGPIEEAELDTLVAADVIHAGTVVWRPGFSAWRPISQTDYAGRSLLAPAPPAKPTTGPASATDPTTVVLDDAAPWWFFLRGLSMRYFKFTGRARRKEYWSFVVLWWLVMGVLVISVALLDEGFFTGGLEEAIPPARPSVELSGIARNAVWIAIAVFFFGSLIPSFAVAVRRLHDAGLTGWLVLLNVLLWPFSLVLMLLPTEAVANKHGPPPRPPRN